MRYVLPVFTLIAALFTAPVWAQPIKEHQEMLYTVVLVEAGSAKGSGTAIYSKNRGTDDDQDWRSFVLTNRHVVDSAITVREEWDPRLKKDVKRERRERVRLNWVEYNGYSRAVGTRGRSAMIVAHNQAADLALLQVVDTETKVDPIATILPENQPLYLFEAVWAIGAGLGKPPFPTSGVLASLEEQIKGYPYMLATAPIIFGNSGGALFHLSADRGVYEFVGVPSAVSGSWQSGPVTHMGWSIPMQTIREFLRSNCYGFILGDTEEDEEKCEGPEELKLRDVSD